MPNFPSIYLELQELWKNSRKSSTDIASLETRVGIIEADMVDGFAPSGIAGGILSGTYPNPSGLAAIEGILSLSSSVGATYQTWHGGNEGAILTQINSAFPYTIKGYTSNTINGGIAKLEGGNSPITGGAGVVAGGYGTGEGGSVVINGGNSAGKGGNIGLIAGGYVGSTTDGGDIALTAGSGINSGGNVGIYGGSSTAQGGHITLRGGSGSTDGGVITIVGGDGDTGGRVQIFGRSGTQSGGSVTIFGGNSTNGDAGGILLKSGQVPEASGSEIVLEAGSSGFVNSYGGSILLKPGTVDPPGAGGTVNIYSHLHPSENNKFSCGSPSRYWEDIFSTKYSIRNPDLAMYWTLSTSDNDLDFKYGGDNKGYLSDNGSGVQLNFTGQHRTWYDGNYSDLSSSVGLIVVANGKYTSNIISINESLPVVQLSSVRNQKNVFGVISDAEDPNELQREYSSGIFVSIFEKESGDDRAIINSLGEGAIWICNMNGNLENGDYITSCEVPGYGMKQDDDLLHNYTVAKITCDCDFNLSSSLYKCEEFEFSGSMYKKAFVGCTYHCG